MKILNGKEPAEFVKKTCRQTVTSLKFTPWLAVLVVGDNPASEVYVRNKQKDAAECGIACQIKRFPADVDEGRLVMAIQEMAAQRHIHGIIVQLPLPKHLDARKIIDTIPPSKDVDCLTTYNQGRLYTGQDGWKPCTPDGVIRLLKWYGVPIEGREALVVGRSSLVGAPLARMLQDENATVTTFHSMTPKSVIRESLASFDIVCLAVGNAKMFSKYDFMGDDIDKETTIVDIGINRDSDGKLCGDFNPNNLKDELISYTPVPGGIGLMTRAALMDHVVNAAIEQDIVRRDWRALLKTRY